jgi:hypothetical protein
MFMESSPLVFTQGGSFKICTNLLAITSWVAAKASWQITGAGTK